MWKCRRDGGRLLNRKPPRTSLAFDPGREVLQGGPGDSSNRLTNFPDARGPISSLYASLTASFASGRLNDSVAGDMN